MLLGCTIPFSAPNRHLVTIGDVLSEIRPGLSLALPNLRWHRGCLAPKAIGGHEYELGVRKWMALPPHARRRGDGSRIGWGMPLAPGAQPLRAHRERLSRQRRCWRCACVFGLRGQEHIRDGDAPVRPGSSNPRW